MFGFHNRHGPIRHSAAGQYGVDEV
jgi:hypothetical protein